MLRQAPGTLFVFGDNLQRTGFGGQAAEMRGEPNAVGIPTKIRPQNTEGSFFSDADYGKVIPIIDAAFSTLEQHLERGGDVVFPADGIGTGRARLASMAPRINAHVLSRVARLQGTPPAPPPKTNPSVVRFLDFDRKKQTADAMLARDPVVEREWYEENTTYPLWNVSRGAENEFVVYRHDAPGYGELVQQTDRFLLALRAVETDAEKWLQDEPYRLMLSKHGLRP
jgi:hypothetical protein